MCFRFLQVARGFIKTGELPHHDHGHVDGIESEEGDKAHVQANPYAMTDNLHYRDLRNQQDSSATTQNAKKGDGQ